MLLNLVDDEQEEGGSPAAQVAMTIKTSSHNIANDRPELFLFLSSGKFSGFADGDSTSGTKQHGDVLGRLA
ncbi:unnamed protein product [Clavelina lepadiformis]|uniref:Uncharacterized protein n=1 Tax=Clavelina lepadiformis TaxID=159417 RepID=A0ABP0FG39_CLALP